MADQRRARPKIEPHPLVEALVPDPGKPPERATKLFGYPGSSPDADATRLWLDLELTSYVDVPNDAVRYSRTLPDDEGTIVWVAADAPLSFGSVSSQETQADFLSGSITAAHLGGAAAGGAAFPFPTVACPRPTLFPPCGYTVYPGCPPPPTTSPTFLLCCQPTAACPTQMIGCNKPSVLTRCPSLITVCQSQTVVCKPSVLIRCPSQQLVCPTSPVLCNVSAVTICQPSLLQCPSRLGCPSVEILCETTPGCPLPTFGCEWENPEGFRGLG